ncbi:hypothetical protein [uncultured Phascolarctobacterium sp.]|uniref:hypothetical protein n=1 Tax=uncultured Phascolarctobacterium sp. TaxID=512296 RepID=UPI00263A3BF3|nr:hypothetical protein [uncultured Phascolarctobacterium sp.]
MDRRRFVSKLNGLSKSACKQLILSVGLRSKDERMLLAWTRLFNILTHQAELLPDEVQKIIKYLVKN